MSNRRQFEESYDSERDVELDRPPGKSAIFGRQNKTPQVVEVPMLAIDQYGAIPARNFRLTRVGLEMYENATIEDWVQVGNALFHVEGVFQLAIGDWLLYGRDFGQSIDVIAEALHRDPKTLQNWSWVASKFPQTLRRETLLYGHYSLLAKYKDDVKIPTLELAVRDHLTIAQLREYLKRLRQRKRSPDALKKKISAYQKRFDAVLVTAYQLPVEQRTTLAIYLRQLADELEQTNGV